MGDAVWAVVELMGHVKLAGRLSEVERFGAKMGRLDIPTNEPCSGETDNWCPRCGRCACPDPTERRDDPACPLHAPTSRHAEAPQFVTQFFGGGSVYRITHVTEAVARVVARKTTGVEPVHSWDFPKQLAPAAGVARPGMYDDDDAEGDPDDRDDDRGAKWDGDHDGPM